MKIGAENRKKAIIAGVLMVVALMLLGRMALVDSGPSASSPTPEVTATPNNANPAATRKVTSRGRSKPTLVSSLDPRLRLNLLKSSEDVKYEGTGRNIFLSQDEPAIPTPNGPGRLDHGKNPVQPTGPPPPAPIDLKFFGFASKQGQSRRVFLAKGEDVFIAGEGDIVDHRFKVLHISPTDIELQDVLNPARHQHIPLTQG